MFETPLPKAVVEIVVSDGFVAFGVPMIVVALGVFIKCASRNDMHGTSFRKEDFAVGFELALASLISLTMDCVLLPRKLATAPPTVSSELSEKMTAAPLVLVVMTFMIWGLSFIVRKFGWKSRDQLNCWCGVIWPAVVGFLALLFTVNWIKN